MTDAALIDETVLPARAGIDCAQDLLSAAQTARGAIADGRRMRLDASTVEAVDGPTVIAIANIARTLAADGAPVSVKSPTSAFVDAFSDLGLFEDLMKMEFVQ